VRMGTGCFIASNLQIKNNCKVRMGTGCFIASNLQIKNNISYIFIGNSHCHIFSLRSFLNCLYLGPKDLGVRSLDLDASSTTLEP